MGGWASRTTSRSSRSVSRTIECADPRRGLQRHPQARRRVRRRDQQATRRSMPSATRSSATGT
jgi:hypothetical protein